MRRGATVHIAGVGACTAVGLTAASTAAAVRAKIAGFHEDAFLVDRSGEPMILARVPMMSEVRRLSDRASCLGIYAAREALSQVDGAADSLALYLGLPARRPGIAAGFDDRMASDIAKALRVRVVETISTGHCAGLMALQSAWQAVSHGVAPLALVGGIDSYLDPDTLEWLDGEERLHCSANPWGFVPGEAAAFCLLASSDAVRRLRLEAYCSILAVDTSEELNPHLSGRVCLGRGLSNAIRSVLQSLPPGGDQVCDMICDMNGERPRADEFAFAVVRNSRWLQNPSEFTAPAECWGDVGAASGPLFATLAVNACRRGYQKGAYTLLWTSSDGGERTAALLDSYPIREGHYVGHD